MISLLMKASIKESPQLHSHIHHLNKRWREIHDNNIEHKNRLEMSIANVFRQPGRTEYLELIKMAIFEYISKSMSYSLKKLSTFSVLFNDLM